jgi:hypothetical protein
VEVHYVGWVEGSVDVMVWWLSCVWAVCGMGGGDMGCVCERWMLCVVVSRLGNGDCVCVCVGPVWGQMVGLDDVGRQCSGGCCV